MKKTLVALLALGSLAMAGEKTLTFTTDTKDVSANGGSYNGIVFTLSDNSRLDADFAYGSAKTFNLTSIDVLVRTGSYSWGENTCMYIVDENRTLVAMSEGVTDNVSGGDSVTFQFDKTSSLIQSGKANANAPLTIGSTYYAYFANTNNIEHRDWNPGVKGIGETVEHLNSVGKQLSAYGQYPGTTTPSDLAFLASTDTILSMTAESYAPMVGIHGTIQSVPEPTTGSLSLLALAGLCARRRKH